jgi:hypothetical protein
MRLPARPGTCPPLLIPFLSAVGGGGLMNAYPNSIPPGAVEDP